MELSRLAMFWFFVLVLNVFTLITCVGNGLCNFVSHDSTPVHWELIKVRPCMVDPAVIAGLVGDGPGSAEREGGATQPKIHGHGHQSLPYPSFAPLIQHC